MNGIQKFEVDCFLQLDNSCKQQETIELVKEKLQKERWYDEWDWDVYEEEDGVRVYGYHTEDILITPGSPATYWEPAEPWELDGYVDKEEVLSDIKSMLIKLDNIDDLEWIDVHIDDEEKILEGEFEYEIYG